jgi:hypothetical protein
MSFQRRRHEQEERSWPNRKRQGYQPKSLPLPYSPLPILHVLLTLAPQVWWADPPCLGTPPPH